MRRIGFALLVLLALAQSVAAQRIDSGTLSTAGSDCSVVLRCASIAVGTNPVIGVTVTGSMTGTLQFEGSADGGTTWTSALAINLATGAGVTSTTAAGSWSISNPGWTHLRVRASALSSGTPKVTFTRGYGVARWQSPFLLAPVTFSASALATTSTDGALLENPTLSTASVTVQQSPRLRFRSHVWNTTATAADNTQDWWIETVPTSGTTPSGTFKIGASLNGGAATYPLTLSSSGLGTFASAVVSGGYYQAAADSAVYWNSRSRLASPADGQLNVTNAGATAGVGFDVLTDGELAIRTRQQNAYANVRALRYSTMAGGASTGAVTSLTSVVKAVAAIADATPTNTLTVTVPNAAHAAVVRVRIMGTLGAGGAVGAGECSATLDGAVVVARTAGLATVATAATAGLTASSCVAGATTVALAYGVSTISGANDATQTFTITVTITKGGGSAAAHTAVVVGEILNANATGVTVS